MKEQSADSTQQYAMPVESKGTLPESAEVVSGKRNLRHSSTRGKCLQDRIELNTAQESVAFNTRAQCPIKDKDSN
ncbi:hypothetical protein E2320_002043 [Naja naja]|nr:hypothetical protein E2320_002043 [Naja naja]